MATSDPIMQGQVPAVCDLCESETKIDWKCLNCDVLMCKKCKEKIHPKLKLSKNHKVVKIKEIGQHSKELDFGNIMCKDHTNQFSCMFCKSCDHLVCPLCIPKVHVGHDLVPISEKYDIHVQRIKDVQASMDASLDKLINTERKIEETRKAEHNKYTEVIASIKSQNLALKRDIDDYTDKLITEVEKRWAAIHNSAVKHEQTVLSFKEMLTDRRNKTADILNLTDVEKFFRDCHEFENYKNEQDPPEKKFESMPHFVQGSMSQHNFGLLQDRCPGITVNLVQQLTTDLNSVFHLSTSSDNFLWLSNAATAVKVKVEDDDLKKVSTYKEKVVNGMAVTSSNDLLLAVVGEATLKRVDGNTGQTTVSVYNVSPLRPTGIHLMKDGTLLCGAKEAVRNWPVSGRRVMIRLNSEGKQEKVYEHDQDSKPLFSLVANITSTSAGIIFVADTISKDNEGRILVLTRDGDVLHIYTGHPNVNEKNQPFKPAYVETTPSDNVIVADHLLDTLHFFNNSGQIISYYRTSDIGIHYPFSLGFTASGHLYIGCLGDKKDAKLYKVDISGV